MFLYQPANPNFSVDDTHSSSQTSIRIQSNVQDSFHSNGSDVAGDGTEPINLKDAHGIWTSTCIAPDCSSTDPRWLVGKYVRVYWQRDVAWYRGYVDDYEDDSGNHRISYDDGQVSWYDMNQKEFRVEQPYNIDVIGRKFFIETGHGFWRAGRIIHYDNSSRRHAIISSLGHKEYVRLNDCNITWKVDVESMLTSTKSVVPIPPLYGTVFRDTSVWQAPLGEISGYHILKTTTGRVVERKHSDVLDDVELQPEDCTRNSLNVSKFFRKSPERSKIWNMLIGRRIGVFFPQLSRLKLGVIIFLHEPLREPNESITSINAIVVFDDGTRMQYDLFTINFCWVEDISIQGSWTQPKYVSTASNTALAGNGGTLSVKRKTNTLIPGISGLTNLGSSCYLNTVLQSLLCITPLSNMMLESAQLHANCNGFSKFGMNGRFLEAYAALTRAICAYSAAEVAPAWLKAVLGDKDERFYGAEQQDAHEALMAILDGLHEDTSHTVKLPIRTISPSCNVRVYYIGYVIPKTVSQLLEANGMEQYRTVDTTNWEIIDKKILASGSTFDGTSTSQLLCELKLRVPETFGESIRFKAQTSLVRQLCFLHTVDECRWGCVRQLRSHSLRLTPSNPMQTMSSETLPSSPRRRVQRWVDRFFSFHRKRQFNTSPHTRSKPASMRYSDRSKSRSYVYSHSNPLITHSQSKFDLEDDQSSFLPSLKPTSEQQHEAKQNHFSHAYASIISDDMLMTKSELRMGPQDGELLQPLPVVYKQPCAELEAAFQSARICGSGNTEALVASDPPESLIQSSTLHACLAAAFSPRLVSRQSSKSSDSISVSKKGKDSVRQPSAVSEINRRDLGKSSWFRKLRGHTKSKSSMMVKSCEQSSQALSHDEDEIEYGVVRTWLMPPLAPVLILQLNRFQYSSPRSNQKRSEPRTWEIHRRPCETEEIRRRLTTLSNTELPNCHTRISENIQTSDSTGVKQPGSCYTPFSPENGASSRPVSWTLKSNVNTSHKITSDMNQTYTEPTKVMRSLSAPVGGSVAQKLSHFIDIPLYNLDMSPFIAPPSVRRKAWASKIRKCLPQINDDDIPIQVDDVVLESDDAIYDCFAIICHHGDIHNGHYTAYIKYGGTKHLEHANFLIPGGMATKSSHWAGNLGLPSWLVNIFESTPISSSNHRLSDDNPTNGQWYLCDDASVSPVDERQVIEASTSAYLLFYTRQIIDNSMESCQ